MGKKILLADDSITIQKVIELTFSDEDFDVVTVSNGRLAIERVQEERPDIVLCDIIMPEKDGYEVCDFIKRTSGLSHIPVLLLTGAFEPFDQDRAARVGCDGYLAKPFEPQTLITRVKELLVQPTRAVTAAVDSSSAPASEAFESSDFQPLYAVADGLPASATQSFEPLEAMTEFESVESAAFDPVPPLSAVARREVDTVAVPIVPSPVPVAPPPPPALFIPEEPAETLRPNTRSHPAPTFVPDSAEPAFIPEDDHYPAPAPPEPAAPAPLREAPQTLAVSEAPVAIGAASEAHPVPEPEFVLSEEVDDDLTPLSVEDDAAVSPAESVFEAMGIAEIEPGPGSPEPAPQGWSEVDGEGDAGAEVLLDDDLTRPGEPHEAADLLEPAAELEELTEAEPAETPAVRSREVELDFEPEPLVVGAPEAAPVADIAEAVDASEETLEAELEPEVEVVTAAAVDDAGEGAEPELSDEVSFDDLAPAEPAPAPPAPSSAAGVAVPLDMVAQIAQRVVGQISEKVIREIAWEVVPELAEALIKREIERIKAELERLPPG